MINRIKIWWRLRKMNKINILAPDVVSSHRPDIKTFNITRLGYCPDLYQADEGEIWAMMQEIYKTILRKDPYWHFFYERSYIHIRCSDKFVKKVQDFLDDIGADYTEANVWYDSSWAVQPYHSVFTYLFHGFSVLAMECEEDYFTGVTDRVIHCYMNHQWYSSTFRVARTVWGEREAEAMLIAQNAISRARYEGYCDGVTREASRWRRWYNGEEGE
jgi:hypothetical protein